MKKRGPKEATVENIYIAYQLAQFMVSPEYCEFCPVAKGCPFDFIEDDMECYVRFHTWLEKSRQEGKGRVE